MPPSFTLRPATAVDQPHIRALIREGRINPMGLKWPHFLVAVDNSTNTVIGCGQIKPLGDDLHELASIAVTRPWRKQGVAKAIIEALQAEYTAVAPLWLMCESRLVPFYTQFGFQEVSDRADMPRHFWRYKRLGAFLIRLFRQNGYLAVMVWPAPNQPIA